MKKLDLTRLAPPGIRLDWGRRFFRLGLLAAALYASTFLDRYTAARLALYDGQSGAQVLKPGAVMPSCASLLGDWWMGFAALAACMLALAAWHYAYHYQGSRSMDLMRRLPNRFELHRRCLTLPLLAIGLCALAAFVLLLIFYGTYMACTPRQCLTPGQWEKIWSVRA